ncbi:DNA-directed RNA polymerase subunit delta [Enterococcus cecorum]|nr:DNA-directed RNA polymerase subunit delta [Enterococcus cecorum]
MELSVFEGMNKNELSMIEVAHAILEQREDVMDFTDLVNQIQVFLEKSDLEIRESLAQFYTDLNIDGSFISLGENRWGLRSWYAIDSIDEELNHGLDDEDEDEEIAEYDSDLKEIGANEDDEEELPSGIEEDLTIIDDDEEEDEYYDEEDEDM